MVKTLQVSDAKPSIPPTRRTLPAPPRFRRAFAAPSPTRRALAAPPLTHRALAAPPPLHTRMAGSAGAGAGPARAGAGPRARRRFSQQRGTPLRREGRVSQGAAGPGPRPRASPRNRPQATGRFCSMTWNTLLPTCTQGSAMLLGLSAFARPQPSRPTSARPVPPGPGGQPSRRFGEGGAAGAESSEERREGRGVGEFPPFSS